MTEGTGMWPNTKTQAHADAHAQVRGEIRAAMHDAGRNTERRLQAHAEDSRIRDQVGAMSDQRAYGSGTEDPRGHRHLHGHFQSGGNREMPPYSGPSDYDLGGDDRVGSEHDYQNAPHPSFPDLGAVGQKREVSWGGDDGKPAYDHSQSGRRR
jgi:hypothetical protein